MLVARAGARVSKKVIHMKPAWFSDIRGRSRPVRYLSLEGERVAKGSSNMATGDHGVNI